MAAVRTTPKGTLVKATVQGTDRALTDEEAEAHAAECNKRAKQLGIEARYEVTKR